jgi:hypothetical protein
VGLPVGDVLLGLAATLLRLRHLAGSPDHLAVGAFLRPAMLILRATVKFFSSCDPF